MRRNSPPRFIRRSSPPRRRSRQRSLSPMLNTPSGNSDMPMFALDNARGRKASLWNAQSPPKRYRSRSRDRLVRVRDFSRERQRERDPFPTDGERSRDIHQGRQREPPRIIERQREPVVPKMNEPKEPKHKHYNKKHSREHAQTMGSNQSQNDTYEENYMDHQKGNNFANSGMHPLNTAVEEPLLDPASISFNDFMPAQDNRTTTPRPSRMETSRDIYLKQENNESSEDRINRLEKLVEKLVQGNVKSQAKKKTGSSTDTSSKDVPELIPSNTKFTTSMWLTRIHEECLERNFDEKSNIQFMQSKMTGIMKAWFKSVSNYDFTWPELKLLITKTFPDNVDFASTLKLLVARDKTAEETITQYFFSKMYLCEACKITGENAVSCLIDGLSNPFMKQDIKSYNFLTPEVFYSEYLSKFPDSEIPVHGDSREVREVVHSYNTDEFIPLEDVDDRDFHMPPAPTYIRGERKKCFTCKRFGHSTLECRHAPICYNCKKKGHIAAKCHFNILLISSLDIHQSPPTVLCEINGHKMYGHIDTGSMTVTMKKEVAKSLQIQLKSSTMVLKGYGGGKVDAIGEAFLNLKVDSTQRCVRILVVPNEVQDYPLIIGQEYLGQDKVAVFIQNGMVQVLEQFA